MGAVNSAISNVVFPVPDMPREAYADLERRKDLVTLTTSKGDRIPAVHKRSGSWAPFTILYSHANAEDLSLITDYVDKLARSLEVDIFAYEYVGYSLSRFEENAKQPSEAGCYQSIEAAWRYLVEDLEIPPERIIAMGRSIGSGPAIHIASTTTVSGTDHSPKDMGGVVLLSPIESGARTFNGMLTSSYDVFQNYKKMRLVAAPVAIIHPKNDEIVPVTNGKCLHIECQNPYEPYWVDNCGHNDVPESEIHEYMRKFFRSLKPSVPAFAPKGYSGETSCCWLQ